MKLGTIFSRRRVLRLYAKIVREKADSRYIARGWAIGMFCGCFFPFGTQLLISIPAAFILRGSKIGATKTPLPNFIRCPQWSDIWQK